ncbi:hypothetical protein BDZ97DRAFT_1737158 [Flammula alnicola]|nr:hypothetical protein BDZ97DRAFT_1737158 [Flammula alnicola]
MADSSLVSLPGKRKRTEVDEEATSDVEHPTRSGDIWFEDGNIILQADNIQFRVHRSVLSNHSNFFKDLFMVPQPERELMTDNCSLVKMPDAAQDWQNLLAIVYHNLNPHRIYKSTDKLPFPILVSMLRLGKKYQFDHFRDDALERLKVDLPAKLADWECVFDVDAGGVDDESPGWYTFNNEVDVINIALEVGIQSILPIVYYLCLSNHDLAIIFDGLPRIDGTTARLHPDSQRVLVLGREKVIRAMLKHTYRWLKAKKIVPCEICVTQEKCSEARIQALESGLPSFSSEVHVALDTLNSKYTKGFCRPCTLASIEAHEAGRQKVWQELPSYFGLPEWENLNDFAS